MTAANGYYECRSCGARTCLDYHLSCTRQCPGCGETALVENLHGLQDPQSVPYKRWKVAWSVSSYGRPRNTTPPPEWIPRMSSLNLRSAIHGGG